VEDINEIIEQRIKKVSDLKEMGIKPYGDPFDASDHAAELMSRYAETTKEALETEPVTCSLAGRIITMKKGRTRRKA
jgi:lysyl-tRNA synthetase class 2